MPLTPTEIANIETLVETSRLTRVMIEQGGTRTVIGGRPPAPEPTDPVMIAAPVAGTVAFEDLQLGQIVDAGVVVAHLSVLDDVTPVTAPQPGRIAAILAADDALVGYGADLIQLDPEITQ